MKKFDITKLAQNSGILYEKMINEVDSFTKVGVTGEGYYEFKFFKNNPYVEKKYYHENLNLKSESDMFFEVPIGKSCVYNQQGVLISEKDHDQQRNFSIGQLIQKVKLDFKIDLLKDIDGKSVSLTRAPDNRISYEVVLKNYYLEGSHRIISIDANDGSVLRDEKLSYRK